MKKTLIVFLIFVLAVSANAQHIFTSQNATISFFSSAPIEDIKAKSTTAMCAIDIISRTVYFKVMIRSFQFRRSMMQEHFNEKYLESEKYPYAEFKGKILEDIDLSKDGDYSVTVQGNLNIHNVIKQYTTRAMIKVHEGKIQAGSTFNVKLVDHHIKIPTLVMRNIAETVEVTVSAMMMSQAAK